MMAKINNTDWIAIVQNQASKDSRNFSKSEIIAVLFKTIEKVILDSKSDKVSIKLSSDSLCM